MSDEEIKRLMAEVRHYKRKYEQAETKVRLLKDCLERARNYLNGAVTLAAQEQEK